VRICYQNEELCFIELRTGNVLWKRWGGSCKSCNTVTRILFWWVWVQISRIGAKHSGYL